MSDVKPLSEEEERAERSALAHPMGHRAPAAALHLACLRAFATLDAARAAWLATRTPTEPHAH